MVSVLRDDVLRYAGDAIDIAEQTESGVVQRRLRELQPHIRQFPIDPAFRQLDQRIDLLAVGSPT